MPSLIDERKPFIGTDGKPIVNGSVYIGSQNNNPVTNPITIYSDRALTTVLANPQQTDAYGKPTNKIWVPGRYSIQVNDSSAVQKFQDLDAGDNPQTGITTLSNVSGTNAITAQGTPIITSLTDKQFYALTVANANTGAVTLQIDAIAAKDVFKDFNVPLAAGDLVAGSIIYVVYNSVTDDFELATNHVTVINNGDITTALLADDAVTVDKIADNAVTNAQLADDAVNTAEIVDDAVTSAKLANRVAVYKKGADIPSAPALTVGSDGNYFDVTALAAGITGATQANPVTVTATAHGLSNGDTIIPANVGGMTELNGNNYTIANVTANTFELSGIDGTSFTAYTSGGEIWAGITSIATVEVGAAIKLHFDGALTLTHHATDLILPTGANITTAAGDEAEFIEYATGDVRCTNYTRANGRPLRRAEYQTTNTTTGGTSIDFTSLPSWASKIYIIMVGLSTSGTSKPIIQIGTGGSPDTSGYLGSGSLMAASVVTSLETNGFAMTDAWAAANIVHGVATLIKIDESTNTWVCEVKTGNSNVAAVYFGAGSRVLSGALDMIRITTDGGADTFDANGGVNLLIE